MILNFLIIFLFLFEYIKSGVLEDCEIGNYCSSGACSIYGNCRFEKFIRMNENSPSSQEYMLYTLHCFKDLLHSREYEKAYWELQKIIDLIVSTYQTDDYTRLIDCIKDKTFTEEECLYSLNAIFEIYTDVIRFPKKQYQSENRTLTLKLSSI